MRHHTHRPRRVLGVLVGALALVTALLVPAAAQEADAELLPVVFVHGGSGSASQFESHAMRLTSNGYPSELIRPFEYDTSRPATEEYQAEVTAALDVHIDALLDTHDVDQVHLLGHSRGTGVSLSYLRTPDRAAKVATYVNIDGSGGADAPEGPRSMGVWGESFVSERELVGAERNVQFSDQGHTQVATSAETFNEIYRFVLGEAPATTDVIPERDITLAGRATIFPQNVGVDGAYVALYRLDPETGQRAQAAPVATRTLGADGAFGPFEAIAGASYEFELTRDDSPLTHHFYSQPYERSNHWIRLQTSNPGQGAAQLIQGGPNHTAFVISRNAEWWGDQGEGSDRLEIAGTNVINDATSPRSDRNIAVFVYDFGVDGESNPDQKIPLFNLPGTTFLTGIDLYVPASPTADGTVDISVTRRGDADSTARVAVPNWASDLHRVTVMLKDYVPLPIDDDPEPPPPPPPPPAPFNDVAGNVHADAIRTLQLRGIVEGVGGGRFDPFGTLRRDQMASIVARTMGLDPVASGPFTDVTGGPHAGAINALAARGIALGTGDGTTFSPRAEISRDQLASFLGRALDLDPVSAGPFRDVTGGPHAGWINALADDGIVRGWDDGTFRPRQSVQRDQAASMVARALPTFDALGPG